MAKVTDVLSTKNYDMFSFLRGNRLVDRANVDEIKASMQEEQLVIPIVVNENFQIIDGQHRFIAAKELGLPIYYIVNEAYGISQILRCNQKGSKKWTNDDFLYQHCELGNENYIEFRNLCQLYSVSTSDMMKIFCKVDGEKTNIFKENFKHGAFVIDNKDKALGFLRALEDFNIGSFCKYNKKGSFISAFLKLYFRPDYDHEVMKNKLETNSYQLTKCATSNGYLSMLCNKIYSYGGNKNAIYFSEETGKFFKKGTK